MGARARRDELIVLVVLVALAALVTLVVAVVEPDLAPSASEPEPTLSSPSPQPVRRVAVGADPYVYACQVAPQADVARIFGAFGSHGYVRQQYLTRTPTEAEFTGASAFAYGGLSSACTYWFDDAGAHSLRLQVTQFPADRLADRRWTRLRRDTRPVSGSGGQVRYRGDDRSFQIRSGRVVVEARYAVEDGRRRSTGPSLRAQEPRMRDLRTAIDQHLADGSATDGPRPTNDGATGSLGGSAYVEPCGALDDAAFAALGGPTAEPIAVDTSLILGDPWTGAAVTSCERSGAAPAIRPRQERRTFAVLEIRFAADEEAAEAVRAQHLARRYPMKAEVTELDTPDGIVDVVEPSRARTAMRTRIAHAVSGPYELRLAVVRDVGPRHPAGRPVTDARLLAAVSAVRASLPVS